MARGSGGCVHNWTHLRKSRTAAKLGKVGGSAINSGIQVWNCWDTSMHDNYTAEKCVVVLP